MCLRLGVDPRGVLYFSLLDNVECAEWYDPRFGLYRVDGDMVRTEKPRCEITGRIQCLNASDDPL